MLEPLSNTSLFFLFFYRCTAHETLPYPFRLPVFFFFGLAHEDYVFLLYACTSLKHLLELPYSLSSFPRRRFLILSSSSSFTLTRIALFQFLKA